MTRTKHWFTFAAVVFAMVAAASPNLAAQGGPPATPPGNPVPGSAPVNLVAPLPLPVTGTVEVTGIPTSITIDNSVANPVLTRDVDVPAREPVQFRATATISQGIGQANFVTVPAGKRLVIEHASASVNDNSASGLVSCGLSTAAVADFMPCESMASNALNHFYAANRQTKFYVSAGVTVAFFASTLSGGGTGFIVALASGYYESVP